MDRREVLFYLNLIDMDIWAYDTLGVTKKQLYKVVANPFESVLSAFLSDCLNRDYDSIYKPYVAFSTSLSMKQQITLQSYDLRMYERGFINSSKAIVIKKSAGFDTKLYDGVLLNNFEIAVDYEKFVKVRLTVQFNEDFLNALSGDPADLPTITDKDIGILKEVFGDAR